jgi:hypothetical protein
MNLYLAEAIHDRLNDPKAYLVPVIAGSPAEAVKVASRFHEATGKVDQVDMGVVERSMKAREVMI